MTSSTTTLCMLRRIMKTSISVVRPKVETYFWPSIVSLESPVICQPSRSIRGSNGRRSPSAPVSALDRLELERQRVLVGARHVGHVLGGRPDRELEVDRHYPEI